MRNQSCTMFTLSHPLICVPYASSLENTTATVLDEVLLSLFVSDSEDEEFSGFSADSDNG